MVSIFSILTGRPSDDQTEAVIMIKLPWTSTLHTLGSSPDCRPSSDTVTTASAVRVSDCLIGHCAFCKRERKRLPLSGSLAHRACSSAHTLSCPFKSSCLVPPKDVEGDQIASSTRCSPILSPACRQWTRHCYSHRPQSKVIAKPYTHALHKSLGL